MIMKETFQFLYNSMWEFLGDILEMKIGRSMVRGFIGHSNFELIEFTNNWKLAWIVNFKFSLLRKYVKLLEILSE